MARTYRRKRKAKKAASMSRTKSLVKRMINKVVETKQDYKLFTSTIVSTTAGTPHQLFNPAVRSVWSGTELTRNAGAQGIGGYQHIGNKILVKKVNYIAEIFMNAPATVQNFIRVMVVHDKKCQGKAVTTSELLIDVASTNSVISPRKINSLPTYKVLMDKLIPLHQNGNAVGGSTQKHIFRFSKVYPNGLPVSYYPDDNTGTISGVQDNSISVIMFADTGNVNLKAYSSIHYQDA